MLEVPGLDKIHGGEYTVRLRPWHVYTISTTTGQGKGHATAPGWADTARRLPYRDGFDHYRTGDTARLLSDFNAGSR